MRLKKGILLSGVLFTASMLFACGNGKSAESTVAPSQKESEKSTEKAEEKSSGAKKLKIVTTNFPSYDFARAITKGDAELTMLVKPGAETHSYEPSPKDIITIQNADLFLYTGGDSRERIFMCSR